MRGYPSPAVLTNRPSLYETLGYDRETQLTYSGITNSEYLSALQKFMLQLCSLLVSSQHSFSSTESVVARCSCLEVSDAASAFWYLESPCVVRRC